MPRTRHASHAGSSTNSPQQITRNSNAEYEPVQSGDLCVGCIVWLPAKDPFGAEIQCCKPLCFGKVIEDKAYGHPVVVLSIRQKENSVKYGDVVCHIAFLTSFQSTRLAAFLKKRKRKRHFRQAIPIISNEEVAETIDLSSITSLCLEDRELNVPSYVKLDHTYMIPAHMLRQYRTGNARAYKWRLDRQSYNILMQQLDMVPEKFERTDTLFETEAARLSALARSNSIRYQNPQPETYVQVPRVVSQTRVNASQLSMVHSPVRFLPAERTTPTPARPTNVTNYHRPSNVYGRTSISRQDSLPMYHESPPNPLPIVNKILIFLSVFGGSLALGSFVWWRYGK